MMKNIIYSLNNLYIVDLREVEQCFIIVEYIINNNNDSNVLKHKYFLI